MDGRGKELDSLEVLLVTMCHFCNVLILQALHIAMDIVRALRCPYWKLNTSTCKCGFADVNSCKH